MIIEKEKLRELLSEAFDGGWYGTLELKESLVNNLIEKAQEISDKIKPLNFSGVVSNNLIQSHCKLRMAPVNNQYHYGNYPHYNNMPHYGSSTKEESPSSFPETYEM